MAINPVDLKRARGNLKLHCKSGTFSTFLFNLFFVRNLSGCLLGRSRISVCRFELATSNTDLKESYLQEILKSP